MCRLAMVLSIGLYYPLGTSVCAASTDCFPQPSKGKRLRENFLLGQPTYLTSKDKARHQAVHVPCTLDFLLIGQKVQQMSQMRYLQPPIEGCGKQPADLSQSSYTSLPCMCCSMESDF